MANVQITQLPAAGPITGTESVPIVQNGVTVQTTTAAIAASPSQSQTFLTVGLESTLPNSRYLSTGTGLGLVDGGAQSFYRLTLNGTSGSLESASNGLIVKDAGNSVVSRTLTASGAGIAVTDGDGVSGNPTVALSGLALALANAGGTGMLAVVGGATIAGRQVVGTINEIDVANGNGSGNPTISLAANPVIPGNAAMTVPIGTAAQEPLGANGQIRYNTTTQTFDGYASGSWRQFSLTGGVTSFSTGGTGLTPSSPTSGAVTLAGVLNVANGGTGASSLTGYVKGSGSSTMTASATIPTTDLSGTVSNAQLANSAVTFNGTTVSLGGSGTITATASNALTISTGLNGTSYNGSTPVTIAIANTGVSAASYGASNKTLTATVNAQGQLTALADTAIAIANTQVSGLGTMSTQDANNVAITGGNINGTTIGGSTAAAGTFTSVAMTSGTVSTAPASANDIVNKTYVDTIAATSITYHTPVKYEAPSPLTATYNNGTAGVGATLTNAGTLAAFAPDGPTASPGDRILVYQQANQVENGIYTVTTVGDGSTPWVLTRATDANSYGLKNPNALGEGDAFFVTSGNTGAGELYVCNTPGIIVFGTTNITFVQVSSTQIYSAGTGLTLSGTQFSISNTGVSASSYGSASSVPALVINAQGQITGASNTPIAINGNQVTSGVVGVSYGGTALSSYAIGDIVYASASTTLAKLNLGTQGYVLRAGASAPEWAIIAGGTF